MRLFEHEAKELLAKHAIRVPKSILHRDRYPAPWVPCVVKAQVLFGNRAQLGGVVLCSTQEQAQRAIDKLFGATLQGEHVTHLLVEEYVPSEEQYYVSFFYDDVAAAPILMLGKAGGSGIEERGHLNHRHVMDVLGEFNIAKAKEMLEQAHMPPTLADLLVRLWLLFISEDCKLLEINPLVIADRGPVALDCRIELDDAAKGRHPEWHYAKRNSPLGRPYTERELLVQQASDEDYRGTVKYIELDGDIAVLAAGGGGSITCMDALIAAGGKPANYCEFSGDPSAKKMYTLTEQALTKPGIKGCWIVGAIANFSRVDVMMEGIVGALVAVHPTFPIVVRRSGPHEAEGLALLKTAAQKYGWQVQVYGAETALTATASKIVEAAYGDSTHS